MNEAEAVRQQAELLLPQSAMSGDVVKMGRVERPIPIVRPEGGAHGWFVPVTVETQIAGYFRFLPEGKLLGYSEFPPSGRTALALWTDAETIRREAEAFLKRPGKAGPPVLTYDGAPARIAWRVPFPDSQRVVFVAGRYLYEAR